MVAYNQSGDKLYEDAVRAVCSAQRGSVSLIQRKLRIGYQRANHLMAELQRHGIVGPKNGSHHRELRMPKSIMSQYVIPRTSQEQVRDEDSKAATHTCVRTYRSRTWSLTAYLLVLLASFITWFLTSLYYESIGR